MRNWHIIFLVFSLLLVGFSYWGRSIWTGFLAVLAWLGAIGARCDGQPSDKPKSDEPQGIINCYHEAAVPVNLLKDPRWAASQLLNDWAGAERKILEYARSVEGNFDKMEVLIANAQQASANAKQVAGTAVLSQESYDLAVRTVSEWHADMAINYSGVKCYRRAVPPPAVEDASRRLYTLSILQVEGKLTPASVFEAREGMKTSLQLLLTPAVSEEFSSFLLDLLGLV